MQYFNRDFIACGYFTKYANEKIFLVKFPAKKRRVKSSNT